MADNVTIKDGAKHDAPVAADVIDGVAYQRLKLVHGADGTATDASAVAPLPVAPSGAGDAAATITDGRKTVTTPGTAVAVVATATPCKWVAVTALLTNTEAIYVGGSMVLATAGSEKGTPLLAGDTCTVPTTDAVRVFIDALVAGEGATFTAGA